MTFVLLLFHFWLMISCCSQDRLWVHNVVGSFWSVIGVCWWPDETRSSPSSTPGCRVIEPHFTASRDTNSQIQKLLPTLQDDVGMWTLSEYWLYAWSLITSILNALEMNGPNRWLNSKLSSGRQFLILHVVLSMCMKLLSQSWKPFPASWQT